MKDLKFIILGRYYVDKTPFSIDQFRTAVATQDEFIGTNPEEMPRIVVSLRDRNFLEPVSGTNDTNTTYRISNLGKKAYELEREKRHHQIRKDKLQDDLLRSALRTNIFIILAFAAAAAGVIFQALNYTLEKSKAQEPLLLKQQDSLKQRINILSDSILRLNSNLGK